VRERRSDGDLDTWSEMEFLVFQTFLGGQKCDMRSHTGSSLIFV
jgi:hypothetical protein